MDVFSLYKPLRNKLSALAYDDSFRVIWAYCQYLQLDRFEIPADIEVHWKFYTLETPQAWLAEWELEILAKEVVLNGGHAARQGRTLRSWNTLSATVALLKNLENEAYGLYDSNSKVLMELVRIAHRQFIWQANPPNAATTTRYFKIFNHEAINRLCLRRLGLTIEEIYLCGTAFMGVFLSAPAINFPFNTDIKGLSIERVNQFMSFTCRTLADLKILIKTEQKYDVNFAYAYSSIRAFPLIRMRFKGNDAIACPLPTLLF